MVLIASIPGRMSRLSAKMRPKGWIMGQRSQLQKYSETCEILPHLRRNFEKQVKSFFLGFIAQHPESAAVAATRPLNQGVFHVTHLTPDSTHELEPSHWDWGCWKRFSMSKQCISLLYDWYYLHCWMWSLMSEPWHWVERWPWQTGVKLCLPEQQSRQKSLQSREILCVILRFFSQEMLLRPLAALLRLLLNDCSMPWHPCPFHPLPVTWNQVAVHLCNLCPGMPVSIRQLLASLFLRVLQHLTVRDPGSLLAKFAKTAANIPESRQNLGKILAKSWQKTFNFF